MTDTDLPSFDRDFAGEATLEFGDADFVDDYHAPHYTLGLMLACLYEHLQRLDVECDVRGAFNAAMLAAG